MEISNGEQKKYMKQIIYENIYVKNITTKNKMPQSV